MHPRKAQKKSFIYFGVFLTSAPLVIVFQEATPHAFFEGLFGIIGLISLALSISYYFRAKCPRCGRRLYLDRYAILNSIRCKKCGHETKL